MKKLSLGYMVVATALGPVLAFSQAPPPPPPLPPGFHQVGAGTRWVIGKPMTLTTLKLAEGGDIIAPDGHSLTMTVDGVETPLVPGTYKGNIVLTPTTDLAIPYIVPDGHETYLYRTAVYVNDGRYEPERSVSAAAGNAKINGQEADDLHIVSHGDRFNGVVVSGNTRYMIRHPVIELTGSGGNDFAGFGAAIRVGGTSTVTIDNAHIDNTGAVRTAIWVGDQSEATINDSEITVHDGPLPKDYDFFWCEGGTCPPGENGNPSFLRRYASMMQIPWMLGSLGTNRATLVTGDGTVTYNNTHITSEGWGALSTDGVHSIRMNVNKCRIDVTKSGYGAYADGDSHDRFSATQFNVPDYGLILGGGVAVFTDGSVVNSRRIGVMAHDHSPPGHVGSLTIEKGTIFNTEKAVIQLKSLSPTITVDDANLHSKSGLILQVMDNDDPNKVPPEIAGKPRDVEATFRRMTLNGDLVNSRTTASSLNVTFEDAKITGAITTAKAVHATGPDGQQIVMKDQPDQYALIGEEIETYAATSSSHGVNVTLKDSSWTVSKTSYLTSLTFGKESKIVAPEGSKVSLTVDGVRKPIAPGVYKGSIVLTVAGK